MIIIWLFVQVYILIPSAILRYHRNRRALNRVSSDALATDNTPSSERAAELALSQEVQTENNHIPPTNDRVEIEMDVTVEMDATANIQSTVAVPESQETK